MTVSHPGEPARIRGRADHGSPKAAVACQREEPDAAAKLPVRKAPAGSCPPAGATETAQEIAARYGAVVRSSVTVQQIAPGVSGMPPLVYHPKKGLVYATKPDLRRLMFAGRPPQEITIDGQTWRSQSDLARALGVSSAAVSKAIKNGKLAVLVARRTQDNWQPIGEIAANLVEKAARK
jgi:hypothetical protein